jgi:hypothetical protein
MFMVARIIRVSTARPAKFATFSIRLAGLVAVMALAAGIVTAEAWPRYDAPYIMQVEKKAGMEIEQKYWMHLHSAMPEANSVTVFLRIFERQGRADVDPATTGVQVRYMAHGVPVSGWLNAPFEATIAYNHPGLDGLGDGVHDLSVEVQGARANDFKPWAAYLHLARDRPYDMRVPILQRDQEDVDLFGPGVWYVDPNQRQWTGYPAETAVSPFTTPPYATDLYQELMQPGTPLFHSAQMWWAQAGQPHRDKPFVRALPPKHSEDHRSLRVQFRQNRLPFKDGPRGIGWMSAYVSGQVDNGGNLWFAEVGGRIGVLKPDGYIQTVAGWRVKPGKDPIWYEKPLESVRSNMELRGQWVDGQYPGENGDFRTPLDIAIDPTNDRILYVAGYEDHCIWKVEIIDLANNNVRVSVFAGDRGHAPGFADGTGTNARFNGPASLVFDPVSQQLYVADQDNDAIRAIDRDGRVRTLFGSPGMRPRLSAAGVANVYDQLAARAGSKFEVNASQAAAGMRPDIYLPQAIRVDSTGRIILLELGYGAIRRLNPNTGETQKLGEVRQKHADGDRGWAWLDVDRWGNTGPKDGIYWCVFVGERIEGEPDETRFNEVYAWLPPNGGGSRFIIGKGWDPYPVGYGRRDATAAPHYPWLIAVDPRGAVLIAGAGNHGVSRLRVRRGSDPVPADYLQYQFAKEHWSGAKRPEESFSLAMKFGWGAHNYLGYADAWGYKGASDAQLLDAFEIPNSIRNDGAARAAILAFLRANAGSSGGISGAPAAPSNVRIISQ